MKKTTSLSFLFAAFVVSTLLLTSCQPAKPDLAQIRTEIQALENGYADGLNAKDANAVIAYSADDAISMANNQPAVSGHDALLQMIQQDIDSDTINAVVSFETVDVFAGGEFVTETGKGISKDSDGNVLKTSKYMAIFEKRNGKYICIRDIYNEDKK
jgi:ketosteroid isomerase-like protein